MTPQDFKKIVEDSLKSINKKLNSFVTKQDLKNLATKDDLKQFPTKKDLKTELARFVTKEYLDKKLDQVVEDLRDIYTEAIDNLHEKKSR